MSFALGLPSSLAVYSVFLLVVAVSTVLAACYAFQLLFAVKSLWLNRVCTVLLMLIAAVVTVDVIDSTRDAMSHLEHFAVALAAVAAVISLCCLQLILLLLSPSMGRVICGVIQFALCLSCAGTAYHCESRFYGSVIPVRELGLLDLCPGQLVESNQQCAITDQGQQLPLYRWAVDDAKYENYVASSASRIAALHDAIIERARPSREANCHGWVFTGGQFLLRGRGVEQILSDNGYSSTERPVPGDLVIYRDASGEILHTGLVRGVLDDGTVIVESKWGLDGRYLHRPEAQPYSSSFFYYHTPRATHLIKIGERPTTNGQVVAGS